MWYKDFKLTLIGKIDIYTDRMKIRLFIGKNYIYI